MIDVLLTFDLEFSAGGAFTRPDLYKPLCKDYVWLNQGAESLGLGFCLDTLEQHGITGVFFTEACNAAIHGIDEMGKIVEEVVRRGHDVQLHLHPAWMQNERKKRQDSFAKLSRDEAIECVAFGVDIYRQWLNKPPISVRTGGLHVGETFYEALQASNISCSSSICLPIYWPKNERLQKHSGAHLINGIVELPVTSVETTLGRNTKYRPLQITSCSTSEIIYALEFAYNNNISPVVILSHHFEYARATDFRFSKYIRNNTVRSRLDNTCKYLNTHRHKFNTTTMSDWVARHPKNMHVTESANLPLQVPKWATLQRMIENKLTDSKLDFLLSLQY